MIFNVLSSILELVGVYFLLNELIENILMMFCNCHSCKKELNFRFYLWEY